MLRRGRVLRPCHRCVPNQQSGLRSSKALPAGAPGRIHVGRRAQPVFQLPHCPPQHLALQSPIQEPPRRLAMLRRLVPVSRRQRLLAAPHCRLALLARCGPCLHRRHSSSGTIQPASERNVLPQLRQGPSSPLQVPPRLRDQRPVPARLPTRMHVCAGTRPAP